MGAISTKRGLMRIDMRPNLVADLIDMFLDRHLRSPRIWRREKVIRAMAAGQRISAAMSCSLRKPAESAYGAHGWRRGHLYISLTEITWEPSRSAVIDVHHLSSAVVVGQRRPEIVETSLASDDEILLLNTGNGLVELAVDARDSEIAQYAFQRQGGGDHNPKPEKE